MEQDAKIERMDRRESDVPFDEQIRLIEAYNRMTSVQKKSFTTYFWNLISQLPPQYQEVEHELREEV